MTDHDTTADAATPLNTVVLALTPEPLSSYLAAIGLLRVLNEQLGANVKGRWIDDCFEVRGLDREALENFLLSNYSPTPVFSPWNAEGDPTRNATTAARLGEITESTLPRFERYREVLQAWERLAATDRWRNADKEAQLIAWRSVAPDCALGWIDAATVSGGDKPVYPPLLGSGGNDGRFEMARMLHGELIRIFLPGKDSKNSAGWLRSLLFGEPGPALVETTIGMYEADAAGTPNSATQGSASSASNPWMIVLAFEGLIGLGSSVATRIGAEVPPYVGSPFMVRASKLGGESADGEDSRGEFLAPLWAQPVNWREIRRLIAEGRLAWNGRPAANSLDAIRAISSLGCDRGIGSFARFQIAQRNGQSYIASPLGRLIVRPVPGTKLLSGIDPWLRDVRPLTASSVKASVRRLEQAQVAVVESGGTPAAYQEVLVALSLLERVVGSSVAGRFSCRPFPAMRNREPVLDAHGWFEVLDDGSPEVRLAMSLASLRDRHGGTSDQQPPRYLAMSLALRGLSGSERLPLWPAPDHNRDPRAVATWQASDRAVVEVLRHRLLTSSELPSESPPMADQEATDLVPSGEAVPRVGYERGWASPLALVEMLVAREVDIDRMLTLARAFSLLTNWRSAPDSFATGHGRSLGYIDPWFAAVRLCTNADAISVVSDSGSHDVVVPSLRRWARAFVSGDLSNVGVDAATALRRAGLTHLRTVSTSLEFDRRALSAALLLRLPRNDLRRLTGVIGAPNT